MDIQFRMLRGYPTGLDQSMLTLHAPELGRLLNKLRLSAGGVEYYVIEDREENVSKTVEI